MAQQSSFRLKAAARLLAAFVVSPWAVPEAGAQAISVLLVNVFLSPGQVTQA
jgi:hypothetical protein